MFKFAVLAVLGLVVAVGCQQLGEVSDSSTAPSSWQERLLETIPPGTSVDEARAVMENGGYSCSVRRDASFEAEDQTVHTGIDYLYCVQTLSHSGSFGESELQVAVVLDEEAVTNILVNRDFASGEGENSDTR